MSDVVLIILVWLGFSLLLWQGDFIIKRLDRLIEILEDTKK